jgi:arylsulfatase A-like enzyme
MIAAMPGVLPPGGRVSTPVAFWDFHATLAEIGGVAPAPGVDGVSFAAQLAGGQPRPAQLRPLYWEFCTVPKPPPVAARRGWSVAVRNGTWKGVSLFSADDAMALYDLASDAGETTDVGAAHPAVVAALRDYARAAHVESALFPSGDAACVAS